MNKKHIAFYFAPKCTLAEASSGFTCAVVGCQRSWFLETSFFVAFLLVVDFFAIMIRFQHSL